LLRRSEHGTRTRDVFHRGGQKSTGGRIELEYIFPRAISLERGSESRCRRTATCIHA